VLTEGGVRKIGHIDAGDTFGEMALMSGDKTMTDSIAETSCQVLRIPVELCQVSHYDGTKESFATHVETIVDRIKRISADPDNSAAAFSESKDPYGLQLKENVLRKFL
jgi:acetate kinase